MNVYDFDNTIYHGDSSLRFYAFCLRKRPAIVRCFPTQLCGLIRYFLKRDSLEQFKSKFFSFFRLIDTEKYVLDFWKKEKERIRPWYLSQKAESDVIISASPELLLKPICDELNVRLIATQVDKSGKLLSKNCKGKNKVDFFHERFREKIDEFYSDSKTDVFLAREAREAYFVKKEKIIKWDRQE